MNVYDVAIVLLLALGTILGIKRGFVKETVSFVGFILVVVISYLLKDTVSVWFYQNLPFFKFGGILKGVTALNILVYEVLAFVIVFSILMILQRVLLFASGLVEKIFDFTIILAPISKLLGGIVGFIEYLVLIFMVLYVISLPIFNVKELKESKLSNDILTKTPVLSSVAEDGIKVFNEFAALKDKYESGGSASDFNYEALDLFLKYDVISVDNVETLVEKDKLKIDRVEELLNKYREEND